MSLGGCYDTVKRPALTLPTRLPLAEIDLTFKTHNRPLLQQSNALRGARFELPMPPPNITGRLHLGHALDLSLQDLAIRSYASRGARTSWTPGCDHAGLATHEKILGALSLTETPTDAAGLDTYLSTAHRWAETHRGIIFEQFQSLHPHTRFDDARFTLDSRYIDTCRSALDRLGGMGRLSLTDSSLFLDLTPERHALIRAIQGGELAIHPEGHGNRLLKMLEDTRPWDIGRTIPWGQRFSFSGHPAKLDDSGTPFTLDTWFSSGLWPTAIKDDPLRPFDGLIIGYDILFFWAARMWMLHFALHGKPPFERIHLHGLIRDKQGRKFSKSLGNGIDPIQIIESHGSDTLRIWCIEHSAWGRDFKFDEAQLRKSSLLLTKMLNATRLIEASPLFQNALSFNDGSTRSGLGELESLMGDAFEEELFGLIRAFEFEKAFHLIRKTCWDGWCEGWLSRHKTELSESIDCLTLAILGQRRLLALLHPFAPATTWWLERRLSNQLQD